MPIYLRFYFSQIVTIYSYNQTMKAIINAKIITNGQILSGYHLLFSNKKIITLSRDIPIWAEVIDAEGAYLSAGFIDIHIHGSLGADVMDGTQEALEIISNSLVATGTTAYLATTMTMSEEVIRQALNTIKAYQQAPKGAKLVGAHLEGPFINPSKHGAQDPRHIQQPNLALIRPYLDIVKMITLAPEVEGAKEFIGYLQENHPDIVLSMGHSDASFEDARCAIAWGVTHATHLFNAMSPFHHRHPGLVGAVLGDNEVSCDLIADKIHLHPSFFDLLACLKPRQLILITDAMRAGCMHEGSYDLGGQEVCVANGEARLLDGTLAGSVLKLNEALRNFYQESNIGLPEVVEMVTVRPAKRLGLKMGELKEDYPADFVLFDREFNILKSFIDGEECYSSSL